MTHVTCRLTAKNWDQLRNPTLGNRVWATFTFLLRRYFRVGAVRRPGGGQMSATSATARLQTLVVRAALADVGLYEDCWRTTAAAPCFSQPTAAAAAAASVC